MNLLWNTHERSVLQIFYCLKNINPGFGLIHLSNTIKIVSTYFIFLSKSSGHNLKEYLFNTEFFFSYDSSNIRELKSTEENWYSHFINLFLLNRWPNMNIGTLKIRNKPYIKFMQIPMHKRCALSTFTSTGHLTGYICATDI